MTTKKRGQKAAKENSVDDNPNENTEPGKTASVHMITLFKVNSFSSEQEKSSSQGKNR